MAGETYRFDDEKIVCEILNDEVVLVSLDTGYYFILDGCASEIWQALMAGLSIDQTAQRLSGLYTAGPGEIAEAIRAFVDELVQENILTAAGPDDYPNPPQIQSSHASGDPKRFARPSIFKYTDMEYLIQMDPIWEYDETGWPKRRTNPAPDDGE